MLQISRPPRGVALQRCPGELIGLASPGEERGDIFYKSITTAITTITTITTTLVFVQDLRSVIDQVIASGNIKSPFINIGIDGGRDKVIVVLQVVNYN